jgi:hypothetical protein
MQSYFFVGPAAGVMPYGFHFQEIGPEKVGGETR